MNDSLFNVCRICYSNENKTTLANWCKCSGTIGLIHKSCLHRWLSQSNRQKCEICKFKYDFRFEIVNPIVNPTFKQWLIRPNAIKDSSELLRMLILLIGCAFIVYFCNNAFLYILFAYQFLLFCYLCYNRFHYWQQIELIKAKLTTAE